MSSRARSSSSATGSYTPPMTRRARPEDLARRIEAALRAHACPAHAQGAKAYLKSDWEFIGIRTPVFRRAIKAELAAGPPLDRAALLATVSALWSNEVFELRAAAVELLSMHGALLTPADLSLVERFVRESQTWALVDGLAAHVAGSLVEEHPSAGADVGSVGARPGLLGPPLGDARAPRTASARRRRLRALLALRRRDARRAGVLHPQGDRVGAAGHVEEATGDDRRVAGAADAPGVRGDAAGGAQVPRRPARAEGGPGARWRGAQTRAVTLTPPARPGESSLQWAPGR